MTLAQPDSTLTAIRLKVRRLTTSPNESSLPTAIIDQAINTFYQSDFPYAIKLDQMCSVYTFFTTPNVDRYPLNVNFNQGIRAPIYFEGVQGYFYKNREEFFNIWPRWPTPLTTSVSTLSGAITNVTNSAPLGQAIVTANNTLLVGAMVIIDNVVGMTQLNGNTYTVTAVTPTTFTLNVDSNTFTPYISGGIYTSSSQSLMFQVQPTPILSQSFVLSGFDISGSPIVISDDTQFNGGQASTTGYLYYQQPNEIIPQPSTINAFPPPVFSPTPLPGMTNNNLSDTVAYSGNNYQAYPGDRIQTLVGSINYITGWVSINFSLAGVTPQPGIQFNCWISQYQPSRSFALLFWNNEFTVRPVPDKTYKVEVETYLTPVQFLETSDNPIINQWWQYIAYGAACEILRERQDFDGVASLQEGFKRQEALVLERQCTEEIGIRNSTIFSGSTPNQGWNQGFYGWPF